MNLDKDIANIMQPSSCLTKEQLNWFIELNSMGFNAYITNNPIFFRDVVLGEIKNNF